MANYKCPFKVGDTVIPVDAPKAEANRAPFWVSGMKKFVGQRTTVTRVDTMADFYILQLDISGDYNWKETWLKHAHTDYTLF